MSVYLEVHSRYCPVAKVREVPSASNIVGWNMTALVACNGDKYAGYRKILCSFESWMELWWRVAYQM